MHLKILAAGVALLAVSGCGTMQFTPTEYPLRAGLVPPMPVSGTVTIANVQPATEQIIVYDYSLDLASNLKAITQLMVDQSTKELGKNGQMKAGPAKTIDIKVNALKTRYIAFFWKSELTYTAVLGGKKTIQKTVHHGSGASPQQDLNGCIGEGVIDLLNDPDVKAYLAE